MHDALFEENLFIVECTSRTHCQRILERPKGPKNPFLEESVLGNRRNECARRCDLFVIDPLFQPWPDEAEYSANFGR